MTLREKLTEIVERPRPVSGGQKEEIQELSTLFITALEEAKGKERKRKPTHGSCCTCQECGYSIADGDECECERNKLIQEHNAKLSKLQKELKGEHAEDI